MADASETKAGGYPNFAKPNSEMGNDEITQYNRQMKENYLSKLGTKQVDKWKDPSSGIEYDKYYRDGQYYAVVPEDSKTKWNRERIFQIGKGKGIEDAQSVEADQLPEVRSHEADLIKNPGPIANELQKAGGVGNLNAGQIEKFWSLQKQREWDINHAKETQPIRLVLNDLHPTLTRLEQITQDPNFHIGQLGFWGQHMNDLATMTDRDLAAAAAKEGISGGDLDKSRKLWIEFKDELNHYGDLGGKFSGMQSDSELSGKVSDALGNMPWGIFAKTPATAVGATAVQEGTKAFAALLDGYTKGKISAPELLDTIPRVNNQVTQEAIREVNDNVETKGAVYPWSLLNTVNQAGDWMMKRPRNDNSNQLGIGFDESGFSLAGNDLLSARIKAERAAEQRTAADKAGPSVPAENVIYQPSAAELKAQEAARRAQRDAQGPSVPAENVINPPGPTTDVSGSGVSAGVKTAIDWLGKKLSPLVTVGRPGPPEGTATLPKAQPETPNVPTSGIRPINVAPIDVGRIGEPSPPQEEAPQLQMQTLPVPQRPVPKETPKRNPNAPWLNPNFFYSQNQLPEDATVGSYADSLPTLAAQEHVDALQPGQPFKWHDGQTYVRV
jgi:hypothetical protein